MEDFNAGVYDKITSYIRTAFKLANEYCDDDLKNPTLYSSIIESLCVAEEETKQDVENLMSLHTLESYDEFKEKSSQLKKKSVNGKNFRRYVDFVEELNAIGGIDTGGSSGQQRQIDGDIEMEDDILPEIDPITKKKLEIPVRNMICNHVYEKNSIYESLKISKNIRCPVAGCPNKQMVQVAHLKDDKVLEAKLAQRARAMMQEDDDDDF